MKYPRCIHCKRPIKQREGYWVTLETSINPRAGILSYCHRNWKQNRTRHHEVGLKEHGFTKLYLTLKR